MKTINAITAAVLGLSLTATAQTDHYINHTYNKKIAPAFVHLTYATR